MNCNEIKRKLALLVGGDLEDIHATRVQRHLAECPHCRETRRQLENSHVSLRAVREAPDVTAGNSLWPRVSAHLSQVDARLPEQTYLGWLPTATLAAACLVLLIFAGSTPLFETRNQPMTYVDPTFKVLEDLPTDLRDSSLDLRNVSRGQWLANPTEMQDEFSWVPRHRRSTIPAFNRHDGL